MPATPLSPDLIPFSASLDTGTVTMTLADQAAITGHANAPKPTRTTAHRPSIGPRNPVTHADNCR
jgi:hypothetical protein